MVLPMLGGHGYQEDEKQHGHDEQPDQPAQVGDPEGCVFLPPWIDSGEGCPGYPAGNRPEPPPCLSPEDSFCTGLELEECRHTRGLQSRGSAGLDKNTGEECRAGEAQPCCQCKSRWNKRPPGRQPFCDQSGNENDRKGQQSYLIGKNKQ